MVTGALGRSASRSVGVVIPARAALPIGRSCACADTCTEELYDAAVAELPTVVSQLTSGVLGARLQESDRDLVGGEDFIDHRAWIIADKIVLAGVKHDDTDVPVQLVVVLRQDASDGDDEDDDWP